MLQCCHLNLPKPIELPPSVQPDLLMLVSAGIFKKNLKQKVGGAIRPGREAVSCKQGFYPSSHDEEDSVYSSQQNQSEAGLLTPSHGKRSLVLQNLTATKY